MATNHFVHHIKLRQKCNLHHLIIIMMVAILFTVLKQFHVMFLIFQLCLLQTLCILKYLRLIMTEMTLCIAIIILFITTMMHMTNLIMIPLVMFLTQIATVKMLRIKMMSRTLYVCCNLLPKCLFYIRAFCILHFFYYVLFCAAFHIVCLIVCLELV